MGRMERLMGRLERWAGRMVGRMESLKGRCLGGDEVRTGLGISWFVFSVGGAAVIVIFDADIDVIDVGDIVVDWNSTIEVFVDYMMVF